MEPRRGTSAGGPAGGPGPLEVVAAEPAGDVDGFADEVEAGDGAGCHGGRVEAGRCRCRQA